MTRVVYEATATRLAWGWRTFVVRSAYRGEGHFPTSTSHGPFWSLTLAGACRKAKREVRRWERRTSEPITITDEELRNWLDGATSG